MIVAYRAQKTKILHNPISRQSGVKFCPRLWPRSWQSMLLNPRKKRHCSRYYRYRAGLPQEWEAHERNVYIQPKLSNSFLTSQSITTFSPRLWAMGETYFANSCCLTVSINFLFLFVSEILYVFETVMYQPDQIEPSHHRTFANRKS